MSEMVCPFCHETDYDLIGLKMHLLGGTCDVFNNLAVFPWEISAKEAREEIETKSAKIEVIEE